MGKNGETRTRTRQTLLAVELVLNGILIFVCAKHINTRIKLKQVPQDTEAIVHHESTH